MSMSDVMNLSQDKQREYLEQENDYKEQGLRLIESWEKKEGISPADRC